MNYTRRRILYGFYLICVIILGLASRRFGGLLPERIATYGGDILWGLMIYLITGILFARLGLSYTASIAAVFSYFIEFSQLYHASWIDAIRYTRIGGLVLGYRFLWSDMLCYTAGITIGLLIEFTIIKMKKL